MHENNFEKQVQEKMDQLGFDPSDSVWNAVDREIDKKKKRPLFWIFLAPGLLLAGGGLYLAYQSIPSGNLLTNKQAVIQGHGQLGHPERGTEPKKESSLMIFPQEEKPDALLKRTDGNTPKSASALNRSMQKSQAFPGKEESAPALDRKALLISPGELTGEENQDKADERKNQRYVFKGNDSSVVAGTIAEGVRQGPGGDSVSGLKEEKTANHPARTSPWSVGFTGSAGISNINQSLFQPVNMASYSYSGGSPTSGSNAGAMGAKADIHAGFSFALGILVNRQLSRRLSLSAGLGYQYLSTSIQTGSHVDSTLYLYASTAIPPTSVTAFYANGHSQQHTNSYQFIQLPVNLNLQLNRNHKNPVIWEAGFSVAWMFSSNSLLYDPYANVYFADKESFTKTQWDAATAVMIGFPIQNHVFQLGPQLQYGLTGLLKTGTGNPGHLYFLGLKMIFIP